MRIAITGARGTVGRAVAQYSSSAGHHTVQINRTPQEYDGTPNSEMRTADAANDYEAIYKALEGCEALIHLAAIPDPKGKDDWKVHNNNVNSAFNGFYAAAMRGIKRVCYASSVNAIGLSYSNRPLHFDYFPIDEDAPVHPTDAYALAKDEAEYQAQAFVRWFPGMQISCLRIHEVMPLKDVQNEHQEDWEGSAVRQLWGWVHPNAVARACLQSVETVIDGCEIFNIIAPETTKEGKSEELAKKYFPEAEIRGDMSGYQAFWTTDKANRILGWTHDEKE